MTNINRDIGTDDKKVMEFVDMLAKDKFLIPTFQREFVWDPENIIKLWDSVFRFYPVGSILFERARGPKEFLEISGTHNEGFITSEKRYIEGLNTFISEYLHTDS